jgi:DNA-binding response OmpR family regulator
VLIIDRDRGIHRMLRLLLKAERCDVIWAPSGADGLAKATASRPVLIIIDWALPDIFGQFPPVAGLRRIKLAGAAEQGLRLGHVARAAIP